jgi:hypothetical protein
MMTLNGALCPSPLFAKIRILFMFGGRMVMAQRVRRLAAAGLAAMAATVFAAAPASAAPMTLQGPFCETTAFDGVKVTMYCYALAQDGVAPYTYSWNRSKGIGLASYGSPSTSGVCTYGTQYRLNVVARDANHAFRENDTGWRTCIPIYV